MSRDYMNYKKCQVCGKLILGKRGDNYYPCGETSKRKYCSRKCYGMAKIEPYSRKKDRLYRVWMGMRERCRDPKHSSAKYYQKNHKISVCEEWDKDFIAFRIWAIDNGYDYSKSRKDQSLDRINNEKGYSPDNCRWVSMKVNNQNTRRNVFLEYQGKRLCISDWSRETGLSVETIRRRIKQGKSVEDILV